MLIKAVVLDMDGLMLDTEPIYRCSWQQASAELGFSLSDSGYERYIGRPTPDCEIELLEYFGPSFPLGQFQSRWPALWKSMAERKGIAWKPGLDSFLSFLESNRIPAAVATSSDADYTSFTLQSTGLDYARFSAVVTRDQVPNGKPAPDLYLEAARCLKQIPADCLALEDSDAGVLAATTAGMKTICIPDLKPPSEAARKVAWRILRSLYEVAGVISS
jgi:beta-phosphoglucomutase-like phosphatase (HAD superfamily)